MQINDLHMIGTNEWNAGFEEGFRKGCNKAIDDFLEKIQCEYLNGCGIPCREIEFLINISSQVAEQLKGRCRNWN